MDETIERAKDVRDSLPEGTIAWRIAAKLVADLEEIRKSRVERGGYNPELN